MRRFFFKTISLVLAFCHLFVVCSGELSLAQTQANSSSVSEVSSSSSGSSQEASSPETEPGPAQAKADSSNSKASPSEAKAISSLGPSTQGSNSPSNFNLSVLQSFQNDLFTGRAGLSLPIVVPPGRKGLQPQVSLNYSSGSGNGVLGLGWSLELGSIERSTKYGVPKYNSQDTFVFNSGTSSTELVPIGGNEYRLKIEGAFLRFYFNGSFWEATDKSGTKYFFGQEQFSHQGQGTNVFKWYLDKVRDLQTNYLTISYQGSNDELLPFEVQYTGNENSGLAGAWVVRFYYETRPDISTNYRSGFGIRTSQRLIEIRVKSKKGEFEEELLRSYRFKYISSPTSGLSLLSAVTQYGKDDQTHLAPLSFQYQTQSKGWQESSSLAQIPSPSRFDAGAVIVDVNNDAHPDILRYIYYGDNQGDKRTFLFNPGTSSWQDSSSWRLPVDWLWSYTGDQGVRLVDVNSDGWTDVLMNFITKEGTPRNYVWLNNQKNAWEQDPIWSFPTGEYIVVARYNCCADWHDYHGVVLSDVNGDGYPDYVVNRSDTRRTYLHNRRNGWLRDSSWDLIDGDFRDGATLIDITGDGLPELIIASPNHGRRTYLHTGSGWKRETNLDLPSEANLSNGSSQFADLNADGLVDLLINQGQAQRAAYINTRESLIWNGSIWVQTPAHWQRDSAWDMASGDFTQGSRLLDFNADGLTDFLEHPNENSHTAWVNPGRYPDLLVGINNGLGAELNITYQPSSSFQNSGEDTRSDLSFPVYVVERVSLSEKTQPTNSPLITRYEYRDGAFDFSQREFRGFGYVKVMDQEDNYTENYFKQDAIFKGRLYKQEVKDKDSQLYVKSENTWQSTQPYSGVYLPQLSQSDNYTYDGDASFRHSLTKFEYDNYGNPAKIVSEGDVDVVGDEKTQVFEYTHNTTDWLLGLLKYSALWDVRGKRVSQKWFYYDEHTSIDEPPTKGLLSKEEVWLYNPITQSEERLPTLYAYDPYGNLLSITDALGKTTRTEYDSLTQSYPIKVTNSLNQSLSSVYYGINEAEDEPLQGWGLFGQLKSVTDLNQQKTDHLYDVLGRPLKVIGPLDTQEYPGVIYEYDLTTQPIKLIQQVKVDNGSSPPYLTTYQFYDGLGRLIQTKSPAEANPDTGGVRQIISEIVRFDQRSQVKERYFPYFAEGESPDYLSPDYAYAYIPKVTFTYDVIGRLLQTTNPDLSYSTFSYSDGVITKTDENGHFKTEYSDAYGQIIKIEEHNQEQTYTTFYQYDAQGNLIQTTDNQGNITQITYDSLGRKLQMADPDMGVWNYEYDDVGNLKKQSDAEGQAIGFEYDDLNRLKKKSTVHGLQSTDLAIYFYDDLTKPNCIGRLSKVIDQSGATEFFYDVLGRETQSIKTVDGSRFTVSRSYDALDRLTKLTYPDNTVIQYGYNPQGITQVTDLTQSMKLITNIDYSPTGQLTKIHYGNGSKTLYVYDYLTLRLTDLVTQSSSTQFQDISYQYDNVGNIKDITDRLNTASKSFVYDDLNRLVHASGNYGTFGYDYDSIGNMIYKEGITLSYGKEGRLPHAVTQYDSTPIDYDDNGNMLSKGDFRFSYDVENRLTEVSKEGQPEQSLSFELSLKPGWNFFSLPLIPDDPKITSVLAPISGKYKQVSRYNNQSQGFEHYVDNPKYNQFDSFEYGKGYQVYIAGSGRVDFTITGTIPQGPQSISLRPGYNLIFCAQSSETPVEESLLGLRLGQDYSHVLYYDREANKYLEYSQGKKEWTSLKPGLSYYLYGLKDATWIITPFSSSAITTFAYDGDGGRVRKSTVSGQQSRETIYIGSLYEKDSDGGIRKHIFAGANRVCTLTKVDGFMTPFPYYYHPDHLGSSNVITDSSGNQVQYSEYTPYGSLAKNELANPQAGSPVNHYFTGKELDSTGLYFYGARYYDPEIGRFITSDTIVQAPYDPQSLNRYAYARNNPINLIDPTGNWSWKKFWNSFAGGVVGAIVAIVAAPFIGPVFAGMIAGAMGGMTTAGISGGDIGQGAYMGAAFGFGTGLAGWGVSEAFGNVGRQIFDSSVVIASGAIGISQGGAEGFLGGVAGSSLVTGIAATATYGAASSAPEAPSPQGFWDTVWDIASFGYSLKQFNANPSFMNGLGLFADTLALLAPGVPGGAGMASKAINKGDDLIRVRHYTNKAGREAIEQAGKLNRHTFVTKADAFPKGTHASTIESKLGLPAGRGKYHYDLNVKQSDLYVPGAKHGGENTIPGKIWQRRLNRGYEIE